MALMFVVYRVESQLLADVDARVNNEIVARFRDPNDHSHPYIRAVERMSAAVIRTTETLIKQQTEQWKVAIEQSHQQLATIAQTTGEQIRSALGESLESSLRHHAERVARFEFDADQQTRARWDQWHTALNENIRTVRDQQAEVARQTEVLSKIIAATAEISSLEQSLNKNLHTLTVTRQFDDSLLSLSAAIQLLSARLSHLPETPVDLRTASQGRAA
jgi:hypothetical protein